MGLSLDLINASVLRNNKKKMEITEIDVQKQLKNREIQDNLQEGKISF